MATIDAAREAGQAGELAGGTDPAQLASELSAILAGAASWPSCTTTTPSTAPAAPSRPGRRPR
jgi:hypothetical protein